jgi:hypothetical protein
MTASVETADAEELLRAAHRSVTDKFASEDPLAQAVLHLINCATDAVAMLPSGNLEAARQSLSCARAAVGAATYAVRLIHDEKRLIDDEKRTARE